MGYQQSTAFQIINLEGKIDKLNNKITELEIRIKLLEAEATRCKQPLN